MSGSQERRRNAADLDAMVAAYLYSQGRRQVDIAQQLGVTQPDVSRYISRAKQAGWLKIEFAEEQFPSRIEEIRQRAIPLIDLKPKLDEIAAKAAVEPVQEVQVFPSLTRRKDQKSWDEARLPAFAEAAARHVKRLIQRAQVLGVSWGETNRRVVNALCKLHARPRSKRQKVIFVPLCGEPLTNPVAQLSSASTLAAQLHEVTNGHGEPLSLNAVPAMIPSEFEGDVSTIRAFLGWINSYREVFGEPQSGASQSSAAAVSVTPTKGKRPLVDRLDTVLTGAGVPSRSSRSVWLQERLAAEGFGNIDALADLVIGDVGGCYLPRLDLTARDHQRVHGMNDRWTGVQERHLRNCAKAAARFSPGKGPPGVVIVALGAEKAKIVAECVRRGIANRLIIDHDLAQALATLVES